MADKIAQNDDKIKQLMISAEQKKAALGTKPRPRWLTNALFKYPDGRHFNLNTIGADKFSDLVDAMSFLLKTEGIRGHATERLGLEAQSFSYGGYPIEEWEEDFKMRISIVQYAERKKELAALNKKLKSLISEGTRTEMELDDIASQLA